MDNKFDVLEKKVKDGFEKIDERLGRYETTAAVAAAKPRYGGLLGQMTRR